ncbi:MAG TPA: formylglycine-generating enzyme family protein [Candidatus Paceibacterota bacterium]|nr:formylglycine-generating enzyme family protein [Verrucomicrobiota bacterium]HSA10990.1 formylglycine-generating enzyme family protein [Candidatus Paceibacterota bacterium]
MKYYLSLAAVAAAVLTAAPVPVRADQPNPSLIYETTQEFFASGDFDRDGRSDLVIVDKDSGKYRLAYQLTPGLFSWVDCRPSGIKGIAGFSIGRVLVKDQDAATFTSPDANEITLVDISSPTAPGKPVAVPFTAALGPNTVVAVDIGGEGNTSLDDLAVGSIYNSPDPSLGVLLRNDRAEFPKLTEMPLPGPAVRGNRLSLKAGQPEVVCGLVQGDKGDTLRVADFSGGKPEALATAADLPGGSDYAAGRFGSSPLPVFIVYKPGDKSVAVRPLEEPTPRKFQFGAGQSFDLGQPVRRVIALNEGGAKRLFVIFGEGEKAGVFNFDGSKAPVLVQSLAATNEAFTCALGTAEGFMVFTRPAAGKFSTRYQAFKASGETYTPGPFGALASLADNDNITIPDIHSRIVAKQTVVSESEMKPYTNTIPGTQVSFAMVPIRGGEFVMGSPETEKGRKPDESPQHKVKLAPFWMGQCEVTWNEYELFMYPDEERRTRATIPTDAAGDKLADAVTHPSKPYVEMSFGMGKDGFPAIAMTQHAANKYCQWLSAKTGQFYRLPTEAEWEYACRAGTTSAYFFGDDVAKLPEYGWYEMNSDFKYQKVGKKKPNPWGLYDMCGNVVEWVLDQYDPEYYKQGGANGNAVEPWNKATKPYPHSVRGGSWDDEATMCRSAARRGSDRSWKMQDPQLPKSVWYFSDAQWVGFRIVRPLKVPPPEVMQKYWTSGVERD